MCGAHKTANIFSAVCYSLYYVLVLHALHRIKRLNDGGWCLAWQEGNRVWLHVCGAVGMRPCGSKCVRLLPTKFTLLYYILYFDVSAACIPWRILPLQCCVAYIFACWVPCWFATDAYLRPSACVRICTLPPIRGIEIYLFYYVGSAFYVYDIMAPDLSNNRKRQICLQTYISFTWASKFDVYDALVHIFA